MAFIAVAIAILGMSFCHVNAIAIVIVGVFGFLYATGINN